jgi:hypothetical protein
LQNKPAVNKKQTPFFLSFSWFLFRWGFFFPVEDGVDAVEVLLSSVEGAGTLELMSVNPRSDPPMPDVGGLCESTKTPKNARLYGKPNKVRREIHPGVYLCGRKKQQIRNNKTRQRP